MFSRFGSCSELSAILIMLNRYFSEKRPLANGLAAAGSPVALCCLSPLGQVLQYKYGWRGGFLILGGILLNCCACGALMRPLKAPKKTSEVDEKKESKPKPKLLDFTVFKDRGFLIYTVAAAIMVWVFLCLCVCGKLCQGTGQWGHQVCLAAHHTRVHRYLRQANMWYHRWASSGFGHDVFTSLVSLCSSMAMTDIIGSMAKDYPSLVVFCIFFGISYGMVGALQFEVLMAIVGTERFSSAIGLVLLVKPLLCWWDHLEQVSHLCSVVCAVKKSKDKQWIN